MFPKYRECAVLVLRNLIKRCLSSSFYDCVILVPHNSIARIGSTKYWNCAILVHHIPILVQLLTENVVISLDWVIVLFLTKNIGPLMCTTHGTSIFLAKNWTTIGQMHKNRTTAKPVGPSLRTLKPEGPKSHNCDTWMTKFTQLEPWEPKLYLRYLGEKTCN